LLDTILATRQIVEPRGWMFGDAGWNVCEAGLRADAVELGRDEQAVHGASTLPAAVRAGEEPRIASEGYAALGSNVR
jgi:hypothetical protein